MQAEPGPIPDGALNGNGAAPFGDDTVHNGHPQPGSLDSFSAKERLKETLLCFLGHPHAGVHDTNLSRARIRLSCTDSEAAAIGHCVPSIKRKVYQYLLDLV